MKEKRIAIMQPYIFPYIGYFQMINAVDTFIFYDDVNYIKGGWINRNRILINNKAHYLTIPCKEISSNKEIRNININRNSKDYINLLKKIEQAYRKAPQFERVYPLLQSILHSNKETISDLAILSIEEISKYLGINTEFKRSSETYTNKGMEKQARLIDICKLEKATRYINAIGGKELYSKEDFAKEGLQLNFIQSQPIEYKQFSEEFVPWLSIMDVLMFNSKEEIHLLLEKYELV